MNKAKSMQFDLEPDHLILKIAGPKDQRYIKDKKRKDVHLKNFGGLLASNSPKIYVVKNNEEIIYIGFTVDSIGNRLRGGIKPGKYDEGSETRILGKDGYHGYKWKTLDKVDYYVWVFEDIETPVKKEVALMFENIEAEMVYLFKQTIGHWPKYQSEIHFYTKNQKIIPASCEDYFNASTPEISTFLLEQINFKVKEL